MEYLIYGLADYVANLKYEDLSPRAKEVAKQVILDSYGNLVFGRYSQISDKIMAYSDLADGINKAESPVSVIGTEEQTSSLDNAVFIHTMMARCADLDDGYRHAMGHPGSGLVPLLLSMAELYKKNGKEMITAITAAYDIYCRLGEAINPFMYRERGFDNTGISGAVAAAALIGKLKGYSAEMLKDAMGIASLFTGGLIEYQNDGTNGKIMCSGWGMLTGLRAARLAEVGFAGPNAALEGRYGFFQAFMGTSGHCDTSKVLTDLGKDFKITSIYFKRHACQRGLHATLDAVLDLRNKHNLTPAKIKAINIKTSTFILRLANPNPKTAVGAQASTQFTSAIILKHGRVDSEELVSKSFTDPEILDLVKKISVVPDEAIQQRLAENPTAWAAAKVIVETTDGNIYEQYEEAPVGDVESPFGWDVLSQKFYNLIEETPATQDKEKRYEFIKTLEDKKDIGYLLRLIK